MGNDHLGVGLGAEGSRLEERLLVPDTLAIDVEPGLDVVDGIDNIVKRLPEFVIEKIFCLWANKGLMGDDIELGVHGLGLGASSGGL